MHSWSFSVLIRNVLPFDLESALSLLTVADWYTNCFDQSPTKGVNTQVCFQFKPTGPGVFGTTLLCIVNNHSTDPTSLPIKAEAYEPNITILGDSCDSSVSRDAVKDAKSSSLRFRPTVVGRSSTQVATLKNNTGIAIYYQWQFPEQRKEEPFALDQTSGVLSPWETKKQVFKFSPPTQGTHDIRHASKPQY